MSSTIQKLRQAEEDELQCLISKAKSYLPDSVTVYRLLSIGFERNFVDKKRTKIYVPDDETLPFFIIITGILIKNRNNMAVHWNPKEIPTDIARNLMKSLPDWDWEAPSMMIDVHISTLREIDKIVLSEDGLSNGKLYCNSTEVLCYIYDKGADSNGVSMSSYHLAPLKKKYADLVYKNWSYQFCEELETIENNLRFMPSMAAYKKETQEGKNSDYFNEVINDEDKFNDYTPVAWVLTRTHGEVGFAFTLPDHRKKGLYTAIMKELIKKLLDIDIPPLVNIDGGNLLSLGVHEKLGFKRYSQLGFNAYLLKGMDINEL